VVYGWQKTTHAVTNDNAVITAKVYRSIEYLRKQRQW